MNKDLIDRKELLETLWRSDVSSREKIDEIVRRMPKETIYDETAGIMEHLRRIRYMLTTIMDTGGTIQYHDMAVLMKHLGIIEYLLGEDK